MSDAAIDLKQLSMFYPKTKKGLLLDYPEIEKMEVFRIISKLELLFVWYFACKSSPFYKEEDRRIRAEKSLIEAFGLNKAEQLKSVYMAGNFSEKIRNAVKEMEAFEIGPRIKAKIMVEKVMDNFMKLVDTDVETAFKNKEKEEDFVKRKSYVDASAKIIEKLPTLINQAERGFGISEKEEGEVVEIDSEELIDKFLTTQDN